MAGSKASMTVAGETMLAVVWMPTWDGNAVRVGTTDSQRQPNHGGVTCLVCPCAPAYLLYCC